MGISSLRAEEYRLVSTVHGDRVWPREGPSCEKQQTRRYACPGALEIQ